MKRTSRTRAIGIWAAWPAALALLLNALLTSTLLAAVSPLDPFGQALICHASSLGRAAADDANDAIKPSAAHCKLCVPALALAPPPSPPAAAFHRIAVSERRGPPSETRLTTTPPTANYESRGPPRRN
uniref:DUF2946 domain-containing protein n=1 Tax=Rhodopseudomonas palustris (strain BisA53) TaxID=316055 RepID=Q07MD9_RHOP5